MSREFLPRRMIRELCELRREYNEFCQIETTEIGIGSFMRVTVEQGNATAWLDFSSDLPLIKSDDGILSYSRRLLGYTKESLTDLALLCRDDDRRLMGIIGFRGISRVIGSTAKELGFEVSEIEGNGWPQATIKLISTYAAFKESWRNKHSRRFLRRLVEPKVAYISRQRLLERFIDIQK